MSDIHKENWLKDRARALLSAAETESDSDLKAALIARCQQVQGQALLLELVRKQATLTELGIPLQTP